MTIMSMTLMNEAYNISYNFSFKLCLQLAWFMQYSQISVVD